MDRPGIKGELLETELASTMEFAPEFIKPFKTLHQNLQCKRVE